MWNGDAPPTPMVEGQQRDREVLGTRDWPGRSRIVLKDGDEGLFINAGGLLGITAKSVLAVYPPAGQPRGERPLGYVRVTEARTLDFVGRTVQFCQLHDRAEKSTRRRYLPARVHRSGDMRLARGGGYGRPSRQARSPNAAGKTWRRV